MLCARVPSSSTQIHLAHTFFPTIYSLFAIYLFERQNMTCIPNTAAWLIYVRFWDHQNVTHHVYGIVAEMRVYFSVTLFKTQNHDVYRAVGCYFVAISGVSGTHTHFSISSNMHTNEIHYGSC